jgi:hypothetical protein
MKLFGIGKSKAPPAKESLAKLRNSVSMLEKVRFSLSFFLCISLCLSLYSLTDT